MPKTLTKKTAKSLARKPWSFLAYIAGDNNLSSFGLEDIQEMCAVGTTTRTYAGVEIDTAGDHTGSVRYEISEPDATGAAHTVEIQRLPEQDTGAPTTFRRFLEWGLGRYTADRRLVVVWNHGAGFRTVRRDIAFDDYGTSLDMNEIEQAMRNAGVSAARKIQVLGFDACLMNMIEVVHHLRGLVEVVVGSEQVEPGDGWPYDKVLAAMHVATTPADLAKRIVRLYLSDYRARSETNVTQSAVDVDATEAAVAALGTLGDALAARMEAVRSAVSLLRVQVQSFEFADYVDLIDLATRIRAAIGDTTVRSAAQRVITATRAAIIANGTNGSEVQHANGLSVWFPSDRRVYLSFRSKYRALHCARNHPGWVTFLDAFHAERSIAGVDRSPKEASARA